MVNRSVWLSVWFLITNTVRHWLFFLSGALASLAGWILQAQGTTLPTDVFLYAGGALMVIALVRAWHELRIERDQLVDDRSPKFEIVFMPANDEDSRPFLQVLAFQEQVPIVAVGEWNCRVAFSGRLRSP